MKSALEIKALIADYLDLEIDLITSRQRIPIIVKARRFWTYLLNQEGFSEPEIMVLTGYDRTSLSGPNSVYKKIEGEAKWNKDYQNQIFEIKDLLENMPDTETEEDLIDKEIEMLLGQI
jgi:chromosomal replication initiation ATPase DnaA